MKDPVQGELPFRAYMETGSLPAFRDTAATVTVQPIQRKKEGYMPMERKPAAQTSGAGTTGVRYVTETER